jgi:hypothetical protein
LIDLLLSDINTLGLMNTLAITEAAQATLAGTLPFPEIVAKLMSAGVEYYHVDFVGMCKQLYDCLGGRVVTPIPCEGLPPVAAGLDVAALRLFQMPSLVGRG